jgi:hypothetical protein
MPEQDSSNNCAVYHPQHVASKFPGFINQSCAGVLFTVNYSNFVTIFLTKLA